MNNYVTNAINLKSYNLNDADKIIVLDNGEVNAVGTHEELLRSCEPYREIAVSQLSEKELGLEVDA